MKAVIDAISLTDPTILNKFKQKHVNVDYEKNSLASKYHYNFIITVNENDINMIADNILAGWYAFAWNLRYVYIIFRNKVFKLSRNNLWNSEAYQLAQQYGRSEGIQEEYLNFKKYLEQVVD